MSIVDKLTYLNTTKQLLKTEINKINNVLDDNSTFRSYPQELFNGYLDVLNNGTDTLWNNLEKVSQTGTEAVLEGVETAPMKMVLNGNTSQETTSGKNLFDQTTNQFLNVSRITWGTNIPQIVDLLNSLNEGQYALSYKVKFDSLDSQTSGERIIGFIIANSVSGNINTRRNETVQINEIYNVEGIITITASNKGGFTNCYLYSSTSSTADYSTTYDVQLEQGSATSYEPYTGGIPSPNPDYPQEVKVVKGENVVSVSGKNLLNMNYLVEANADKTYAYQGFWGFKLTDVVGTYTLSRRNADVIANSGYIAWGEGTDMAVAYNNKTWLAHPSSANLNNKSQTKTNTGELWLFLYASMSKIENIPNDYGYLMLEQGSTATPYVPYSKTDYPISLGTLELCKIGDYKDYLFKRNGKWYVHKAIGKVVLDGSESWGERTNVAGIKQFYVNNTLPAIVNATQYCNYFAKYNQNLYNYGSIGEFAILTNTRQFFGCVNNDLILENFKTLLASNNLIVYYVLATPTETEITNTTLIEQLEAISNAKSVKDKTYITQTNDELPFILDVEAIKEYEVN